MKKLWHWLTFPYRLQQERDAEHKRADYFKDAYFHTFKMLQSRDAQIRALRAQLVQVRVSQSRIGRAGWEVMAFIPEEVLLAVRKETRTDAPLARLLYEITRNLVTYAVKGINRVDSQGRVCALVFAPLDMNAPAKAPDYVQALFEKDGEFKMSEKCWDTRTEGERMMQ